MGDEGGGEVALREPHNAPSGLMQVCVLGKILPGIVIGDVSLVWRAWCRDVWGRSDDDGSGERTAIIFAIL